MSWKKRAKSETRIQEQITGKGPEKSSGGTHFPNLGNEKSLSETLLIPLKFDFRAGEILKVLGTGVSRKNCFGVLEKLASPF